jgi:hypothetical protein
MQMQWTDSFTKRLTFGASKAYVNQLDKGMEYKSLCPVYGLGIIDAVFDKQTDEWYHHYKTINVKDHQKVLEGLELIFIELPKFTPTSFMERKLGVLWLRFLSEIDKYQEVPQEFKDSAELSQAIELSQESAYTKGELEAYDRYLDAVRVERTFIVDALAKGRAEGLEEGRAEGREEEKFNIARSMKANSIPLLVIAQCTGLPEDVIEKL